MPDLSVCIPAYNPGPYLRLALESILAQDGADFEVIVSDDCSTEPLESLVEGFADSRVSYFRNLRTRGLAGNWNQCIELASGTYITIFHQDDLMRPNNLARKAALLASDPGIGLVYSNIERIDAVGNAAGGHWASQPESDYVAPGSRLFELVASSLNPVSCPSVMVRRECYRRLGGFSCRLPYATDLEMWLRIARHYKVGYLAESLIQQRVHAKQETRRFSQTGHDYLDVLRAFNIAFLPGLPSDCAQYRRAAYATLRRLSIKEGRWKLRQGQLLAAVTYMGVAAAALWHGTMSPEKGD